MAKHQTIQDRWLIGTFLTHLEYLYDCSKVLKLDARRAAAAGDGKTALDDICAILRISRHCEEVQFVVCTMHAELHQKTAFQAVQEIIRDYSELWTSRQLQDLAHQVANTNVDWRRGIEGERKVFYDTMQRIYTDNGNGDGRLALFGADNQNLFQLIESITNGRPKQSTYTETGLAMLALPAANMVVASRKKMVDEYDRLTDKALEAIDLPLWVDAEFAFDAELSASSRDTIGRFRNLFLNILFPAYRNFRNNLAVLNGERDGALVGLALELFHRENKKWPAKLAVLSPRWLSAVPVDRITGKPLGYKVVDDRPIVYSVGVDLDDDGGRIPADYNEVPGNTFASPEAFNSRPFKPFPQNDGDWVLWSTLPKK